MEIYVAKSGKETGPFSKEQIYSLQETGMLVSADLVWHEGLPQWVPVHQFLGLRPPLPESSTLQSVVPASVAVQQQVSRSGEPASFWIRAGAYLIDWIFTIVALYVLAMIFRIFIVPAETSDETLGGDYGPDCLDHAMDVLLGDGEF